MDEDLKNKKGFTLIELLAVIIILGVLLLLAIPAVSKYIVNSRLKTYKTNLVKMVDAVMTEVNSYQDNYNFSVQEYLVVPSVCIETESGATDKSPFGKYEQDKTFVLVTRGNDNQFVYYVSAKDVIGYGNPISLADDINVKKVKNNDVGQITSSGVSLGVYDDVLVGKKPRYVPCEEFTDVNVMNENSLAGKVLAANEEYADNVASEYVSSSTGIDFSQPSGDTNGKGLYYTSTNTEGDAKVYYFRGDVENNYVSFAGKTWRIVRINEDGSVRLITQEIIGNSHWNSDNTYNLIESSNTNAQAGYMYGTYTASTYAETHANTNNSDMKDYLDNWYTNNLSSYSGLLSTTAGFCNDRTVTNSEIDYSTTHLGTSTYNTDYGARYRLFYVNEPQFACPQTNDLFTVSGSSKGNKALTKNIGLLTADEAIYAGAMSDEGAWDGWDDNEIPTDTTDYGTYLNIGSKWVLMSPGSFYAGFVYMNYVNEYGNLYDAYMGSSGVRPVINLSMSAVISGGNGTSGSPYVVKTN